MNNDKSNWSLFLDLDGTLYSIDKNEFNENIKAVKVFCKKYKSLLFIATGRSSAELDNLLDFIKPNNNTVILYNGALVKRGEEILFNTSFRKEISEIIYDHLDKHNYSFFMYSGNGVHYTKERENTKLFPPYSMGFEPGDKRVPTKIDSLSEIYDQKKDSIYKFLVMEDKDTNTFNKPFVQLAKKLNIKYGYTNPTIIEINPPNISKAFGIKVILKEYNLDMGKTMSIGDGENDIPMFEACKLSIAMNVSSERSKAKATAIAQKKGFISALNELEKLLTKHIS